MRAVQLVAYGNPVEALEYVDIPAPEPPGPNQVLIGVEFSPINPSDLLLANGFYALRPTLPTVIGNEAVGRVLDVGPGVQNVKLGDRVLAPLSSFTWRERMIISAEGLFTLPPDADPRQLAMLAINPPTAASLLSEYVNLKPSEWVVQNAANSGVGRWVIAFAKMRGLKTVNIVRRPELVPELEAIGGDLVVVDSPDVSGRIKTAVGQAELRLALDGVSGPATGVLEDNVQRADASDGRGQPRRPCLLRVRVFDHAGRDRVSTRGESCSLHRGSTRWRHGRGAREEAGVL